MKLGAIQLYNSKESCSTLCQPMMTVRPGPGWGPVRVGARSGLGPIWAQKARFYLTKHLIKKTNKIANKDIKGVKSEQLKVKCGSAIRTCLL